MPGPIRLDTLEIQKLTELNLHRLHERISWETIKVIFLSRLKRREPNAPKRT